MQELIRQDDTAMTHPFAQAPSPERAARAQARAVAQDRRSAHNRALAFLALAAAVLALLIALPRAALAQNLFAPVIKVNDAVITGYELEQRTRFLTLLRAPGDPAKLAREQLIDDRLKMSVAKAAGITATPEQVLEGMEEFAARANMNAEQFIRALEGGGVSEQTFRAFAESGLVWREYARARFASRVSVSEAELDRAERATAGSDVRVLLSEIIMVAPPAQAAAVQARAADLSRLEGEAAFASAARKYSASPTRGRGGKLEWMPLTKLPPALRPIILGLAPGQVSAPIPLNGAVALFQMRAIEETGVTQPEYSAIEYAAYYIPGGRSPEALAKAAKVAARVDTCDDLYGVAKGQPVESLERGAKAPAEIPQDIALELAKLDDGEVSTTLTRANGQTLVFLMLCGRSTELTEGLGREDLSLQLKNRRLAAYAEGFLAELRSAARITDQ